MIIRVRDKNNDERYFIEAAWIKWSWNKEAVSIAVYTHVTKTRVVAELNESKIEVAHVPSVYIHLENGDTVCIMNNDGKIIGQQQITIGAVNRRAERMLSLISISGLCAACIIEESCTLLKDHVAGCQCKVCEEYGKGAFFNNEIDSCDQPAPAR